MVKTHEIDFNITLYEHMSAYPIAGILILMDNPQPTP
jgi:hypothetical protein